MISKKEIKFILYATVFSFLLFGLLIPFIVNKGIVSNLNPYIQFAIFNIGIFVFLQLFLVSAIEGTKIRIMSSMGLLALFMALDILAPPLMVSTNGELATQVTLGGSATDFIFGTLLQQIGINGFLVYLLTYVLAPFILLLLASLLLKNLPKNLASAS